MSNLKTQYFYSAIVLTIAMVFPLCAETTAQQKELQEKVKAYLGVENLQREQTGGFVYQFVLQDMYGQLTPELQKVVDGYLSVNVPERQKTVQSPSGKFSLHYDTSGTNAVPLEDISGNGIPDFIDSASVFFDYAWQVEIEQLGFQVPMDVLGNEIQVYQIIFSSLSSFDYGFTNFQSKITGASGTYYTSYIEMDNDFQNSGLATKGLDGLRVTAAHEFNHAIQLGYPVWTKIDPLDQRYFLEMLSTWMEEVVYGGINDYYQYMGALFGSIQSKRFTSESIMYGNSIYFQMLEDQYNPQINIEILETIGAEDVEALDAMDIVLKRKGSSFSESLNDYGKWMYFTDERAISGEFFNDAAEFPAVIILSLANGITRVELEINVRSESFYYIAVDTILQTAGLTSVSTNDNNSQVRLNHFNSNTFSSLSVASGTSQPVLLDFAPQDLTFLISNSRDSTVTVNFMFNPDSTLKLPEGSKVVFGPSPARVEKGVSYFYRVPANSKIAIMDLNQRPVRTLQSGGSDNVPLLWDLRDGNGNLISSGIYFFIVISPDKEQVGKIAVVR